MLLVAGLPIQSGSLALHTFLVLFFCMREIDLRRLTVTRFATRQLARGNGVAIMAEHGEHTCTSTFEIEGRSR